jgi:hypothetical protein
MLCPGGRKIHRFLERDRLISFRECCYELSALISMFLKNDHVKCSATQVWPSGNMAESSVPKP